jgi:hypothetical protein
MVPAEVSVASAPGWLTCLIKDAMVALSATSCVSNLGFVVPAFSGSGADGDRHLVPAQPILEIGFFLSVRVFEPVPETRRS